MDAENAKRYQQQNGSSHGIIKAGYSWFRNFSVPHTEALVVNSRISNFGVFILEAHPSKAEKYVNTWFLAFLGYFGQPKLVSPPASEK